MNKENTMTQQLSIQYDVEEAEDIKHIKLGELFTKTASVNPAKHTDEEFELYSIPSYDNGMPDILKGSEIGSSKISIKENDVLLSRIVPHIRRCWVVSKSNDVRKIGSSEWIVFRSDKVIPYYLRYFLLSDSFHNRFIQTISGVGGSLMRARPSEVAKLKIPLPPLPIQQKIAQVLDRADALRQRNRQIIRHYDQLAQSVFLEMFSHAEGKLVNLEEVVKIQNGQVDPNVEPYSEMIHVGGANIESGTGNLINLKSAKEGMLISGKYLFTEDHVLYSKIRPYLNKVSKPGFTGICSADIYPIKPNSSLTKEYLMFLLRSIAFLNYANNNSGRANIPKINRKDLLKFEFQLPSFKKQSQFTEIMNNIEAQKQQQQHALAKSEELFQSLLQRAFKGELLAEAKTNPPMEMF